jgi:hypothetical protein
VEVVGRGKEIDQAAQDFGRRRQQHFVDEMQSVGQAPKTMATDAAPSRTEAVRGIGV